MEKIILLLGLLIIISGCITETNNNTTIEENDECQSNADCDGMYCKQSEGPALVDNYPICEYNKCVCGCGDPENGELCD